MAGQSTNIKIEPTLKKEAQQLFASLGMDMTTAVNIFLRQSVKEQAIPFRIGQPAFNAETLAAIDEVAHMKSDPDKYKGYKTANQMMEDIVK